MCNLTKSKNYTTAEERKQSFDSAFEACNIDGRVTIKELAEYMGLSERTVRSRLKEFESDYWLKVGIVERKSIERM